MKPRDESKPILGWLVTHSYSAREWGIRNVWKAYPLVGESEKMFFILESWASEFDVERRRRKKETGQHAILNTREEAEELIARVDKTRRHYDETLSRKLAQEKQTAIDNLFEGATV